MELEEGQNFRKAGSFGPMAGHVNGAIGLKAAHPDRTVVVGCGEGCRRVRRGCWVGCGLAGPGRVSDPGATFSRRRPRLWCEASVPQCVANFGGDRTRQVPVAPGSGVSGATRGGLRDIEDDHVEQVA
ncbi:hypothetical protein [Streptomyces roseoverticillatus]|uniref:hypothetical protein n=1 Tax=Streptomyces roseoverticillatus TaxID=66429 RepID=UPI003F56FD4A